MTYLDRRRACLSLLGAAGYGCSRPAVEERGLTPVRMGMPRNAMFYLPVYLADELGYFRQEGLKAELQDLPGGAKNIAAMLGGSTDVIGAVYEHTIWLAAENRAAQCFYLLMERPGLALIVSPATSRKITSIADLKGASVGVANPGSQSHIFLNFLLHKHGMPADSVNAVGVGLGPGSVVAVQRGKVDAAAVSGVAISMLRRRHPGLVVLADAYTAEGVKKLYGVDTYPSHALLAPAEWLHSNTETARKIARATQRANQWMHQHQPEEIQEKIPEAYRLEDTATELEAIRMATPMYSSDGRVRPDAAEEVRRVMDVSLDKVRTATIDLSQTYTSEYLQAG
jgi:NitT/TauT family transport system substrate-binding protein